MTVTQLWNSYISQLVMAQQLAQHNFITAYVVSPLSKVQESIYEVADFSHSYDKVRQNNSRQRGYTAKHNL